ncbi:MAG: choice-of-anchor Q domain-containing protein, partial [Candidatus Contendobacter sp.]
MFRRPLPPQIQFISLIVLAIYSLPAGAATFTVTNLNDSGAGSLRQAILDANATVGASANTIVFQAGLSGNLSTAGNFSINGKLELNGPGADVLTLFGDKTTIFVVNSGATLTLSGLKLTHGQDGIVNNYGTLTVNNSIISDNAGRGIYNPGGSAVLTVNDSVVSNNASGGISNNGGTVTVNRSTLSGNTVTGSGGGISINSGIVTVNYSTLSGNTASHEGGGIYNGGTLTVSNSTLSGNSATFYNGGGIHSVGQFITVTGSTLSENKAGSGCGGGLNIFGYVTTTVTFHNNTLSGNTAYNGGGLCVTSNNKFNVKVVNSTLSGNTASSEGGGIYSSAALSIGNSLVAGNTAPNVAAREIYIVPSSSASNSSFVSDGYNLFGVNGNSGLTNASPIASDLILAGAIDTAIGDLADNGGPTQTHLPVAGSPALNAGDNALVPAGIATDQRGSGFSRIVNNVVDIGAAEVQPPGSLVAGLTSTGQIYYTTVAPLTAGDEGQLATDATDATAMDALPHANAWGNIPGQLAQLRIGDFNGDGEGDLIGVANNGSIWYTTNRGPWASVPGGLSQISVGDFNGDGKDGLIGLAGNGSIWYTNDLSVWTQIPGGLSQIAIGDLNGDGKADL